MLLVGIGVLLIALHVIGVNVKMLLKIIGMIVFIAFIALLIAIGAEERRAQKNSEWKKERDAWIAKQPPCKASSLLRESECKYERLKEYERKHPKPYPES